VVRTGDFDGDRRTDLFWRNGLTGANVIWRSADHAAPLAVPTVADPYWQPVASGDFNGDGRADVFWRRWGTGETVIWLSANHATAVREATVSDMHWTVVGSGDFDGDGKADVFWRNLGTANGPGTGANVIWRSGSASTPLAVATVPDLNWMVMPYEGTLGIFF
jgi:hypothetical protein